MSENAPTENVNATTDGWSGEEVVVKLMPVENDERVTVPAGRYFVGDPCYTAGVNDYAWRTFIDLCYGDKQHVDVLAATFNGYPVVGIGTAYGDGEYMDYDGNPYAVDAGMIGVVAEEVVIGLKAQNFENLGRWVTFETEVELVSGENGRIHIGEIEIPTGDDF